MSGGTSCKCDERKKAIKDRKWAVRDRNCNHSAFNGYRRTPSSYSLIVCYGTCNHVWRTKAGYVSDLPDETKGQMMTRMWEPR